MTEQINNPSRQALMIHHGAIGDFLVASRLMELCNAQFGPFSWDLLGKPHLGRLAKTLNLIKDCYDFSQPGWHHFFAPDLPIDSQCQSVLNRYDLVLNVVAGSQSEFSNRLKTSTTSRVISIEPKLPADYSRHVYQFLAEQITRTSIEILPSNTCQVDAAILSTVSDELHSQHIDIQKLVLIHPGASGRAKRWPIESFVQIADSLRRQGSLPAFLIGEVEQEQFDKPTLNALEKTGPLLTNWSLERLSALISLAGIYIGNDNGISHLAGMVGARTYVIFVLNNANNWKPLGPKVICTHISRNNPHS
jgi:ADP-heptose:LPS heptosyltransferase